MSEQRRVAREAGDEPIDGCAAFDALIRAHGIRFVVASRLRCWAWRAIHEPAWAHGLLATTALFGAPGLGSCDVAPRATAAPQGAIES